MLILVTLIVDHVAQFAYPLAEKQVAIFPTKKIESQKEAHLYISSPPHKDKATEN